MQQETDYFVRLGLGDVPAASRAPVARTPVHPSEVPPRARRRKQRLRVRTLPLLALALLGWLIWASLRPGGVSGTVNGFVEHLRGDVRDVSTNSDVQSAAAYFQHRFKTDGAYPNVTESDVRNDPAAQFGVGVAVDWCSPSAVVLQGYSAGGTVSRLLLNGKDLGGVAGKHDCPTDLSAGVAPWRLPKR